MTMRSRVAVLTMACAGAITLFAQSNSSLEGKWVLNVAKSKFTPGPAPKSETVTIQSGTATVEGTDSQGNPIKYSFPTADGKQQIDGMTNSTVDIKAGANNTFDHTWNSPTGTSHGHGVISKDGKTMHYTLTGKDQNGKPVHDVEVFEKQ